MGFLAPWALLALPLIGLIVALYLLRFRRPSAPVGSLHLWQSLVRDREANSLWQKLRVSTLLILQVLAMLALVLALARPWARSAGASKQNAVIVVDVSASMAATDGVAHGHSTRLSVAVQQARDVVDSLSDGSTASLISSDVHAVVLVPPSESKARLRAALDSLQVRPSATDMSEAMQLASIIAAQHPPSTVWVYSDGVFPAVTGSGSATPAGVRFVPVGTGGSNQGITSLLVGQTAGRLSLFAQVTNSDNLTASRRLDLSVDDAPWNARTVVLGPGETQQVTVDDVPTAARVIQARLAGIDDLEMDDTASTVNRSSIPANVLLVSGGNRFLELAAGLLPNVTLYKVAPADYNSADVIEGAAPDLTIFDSDVLTSTLQKLPSGSILFVGPQASTPLFEVKGVVTSPQPVFSVLEVDTSAGGTSAGERDPLLRFVDLSALHVAKAWAVSAPPWAHVVLGSDKGPLIVAGRETGRRVAVLAFDLHDSDLTLQTAYPLLMRNLIAYLLPDPTGGVPVASQPEAPVSVGAAGKDVSKIVVEDPAGNQWTYPLTGGADHVLYPETGQLGVYYITQYAGSAVVAQEAFVVNLAARDESMIRPNLSPGLPAGIVNSGSTVPVAAANTGEKREVWPLVALAGFGVLLIEWLFAQRMAVRRALVERRARRALRKLEHPQG